MQESAQQQFRSEMFDSFSSVSSLILFATAFYLAEDAIDSLEKVGDG